MSSHNLPATSIDQLEEQHGIDYELDKFEDTEDKCPECGTYLKMCYRSLGIWDYAREWHCGNCGLMESE